MYSGFAQAPVVRMTSTSRMMNSSYDRSYSASTTTRVQGIQTSASSVYGGVTAGETYARMTGVRKTGGGTEPGGNPNGCYCEDHDGDGFCDHCGALLDEFDGGCSNDPCWCPLPLDWTAILFLLALTCAYVTYKETKKSRA